MLDPLSPHLLLTPWHPNKQWRPAPAAIGEEFLRLAAKYCFNLDSPKNFLEIFEPLQVAIGSPGGSERALQTVQAAIEHGDARGHIALHIDAIKAYNEADRGQMLSEVYADTKPANTWCSH